MGTNDNPHAYIEYESNSPEVNVWCCFARDSVIGPYFFAEKTGTSATYIDMLAFSVLSQIEHEHLIFQINSALPY